VNGARLEYLDWGGTGAPMLFLAGLSDTPYIFNDLAPEFTARYHCIGLTRRGFGKSEQTVSGYELDNLLHDIVVLLDKLGLKDVTLVGHSLGGTEAIRAAEVHPALIRRVVLLDTAYDSLPDSVETAEESILTALHMSPAERLSSLDAYRKYMTFLHRSWSNAAETNLREQVIVNRDGTVKGRTPERVYAAFTRWIQSPAIHLSKIPVPALMIFADNPLADKLIGVALDERAAAAVLKASAATQEARGAQIAALRRNSPQAQVVELAHTDHRCFIDKRERVVTEMRYFLP
jgi:pimeloyl-ACP methyl ester carboxylesterase